MNASKLQLRVPRSKGAMLAAALAALGVCLFAVGTASADERVRFKNGHTITAVDVQEKGDFIYLIMRDGSRVGFPKELIAEHEEGVKSPRRRAPNRSGWGGRGPSMRDLQGYQRQAAKAPDRLRLAGDTSRRDSNHEGPYTYGFSYKGSGYNGGERRTPGPSHGVNLRDYLEGRTQNNLGQGRRGSSGLSTDKKSPKNRLMPVIEPRGQGRTQPNPVPNRSGGSQSSSGGEGSSNSSSNSGSSSGSSSSSSSSSK